MDIIHHTTQWAKGDMLQGRIMLLVGLLILVAVLFIFKGNHVILKGTLMPLGIAVLILVGYGGFLAFSRAGHLENVKMTYAVDQKKAISQEHQKALKDHNTYTLLKKIWVVMIALSAIAFLIVNTMYLKGLCIGLIGLFFTGLVLDTTLDHRLTPYLDELTKLTETL